MRLKKARIRKYRSIRDTGFFDVEPGKTILVGPNEAGKTAILEALQRINPPGGIRSFNALRDYPRSEFGDIAAGKVRLEDTTIVEGHFALDPQDKEVIPAEFREADYVYGRRVDNSSWHAFESGPPATTYGDLKKDLARLCAHIDGRVPSRPEGSEPAPVPSAVLSDMTKDWTETDEMAGRRAVQ